MRHMYTIYDIKSESIVGGIILEKVDAPAIRAFHDALNPTNQTVLAAHPGDFQLLCIGAITDAGEIITPTDGPSAVATGSQWAAANTPSEN